VRVTAEATADGWLAHRVYVEGARPAPNRAEKAQPAMAAGTVLAYSQGSSLKVLTPGGEQVVTLTAATRVLPPSHAHELGPDSRVLVRWAPGAGTDQPAAILIVLPRTR
jgi:hypothetical protein